MYTDQASRQKCQLCLVTFQREPQPEGDWVCKQTMRFTRFSEKLLAEAYDFTKGKINY